MRFPIAVLLAATSLVLTAALRAAGDRPPDLVIFLADDLSVEDCTPYGNRGIKSPHMQALAEEGLTFDRAYVASPSCAPSRAALLTARYGLRSGSTFNHQPVDTGIRRWPSFFQDLGYQVVAIGKVAHYAQVTSYGFDKASFYKYHQDACVEKAVEWLAQRKSRKPLCLFVGTNWPHVPWPVKSKIPPDSLKLPPELADTPETRVARARYAAAVGNADRDLGQVRAAVKRHLPEETVFLFTSDHGSQFPFSKWNLYEAGLRVPLIVSWPGHVAANQRTGAMVSWLDLMPTLMEIAGADPAKAAPGIDGRSFLPVLKDPAKPHRDRILATHSGDGKFNFFPARSVRIGRWKYIRNIDPTLEFHSHVDLASKDTGYWPSWVRDAKDNPKIAAIVQRYLHRPAEELYNLESDPDELVNLVAKSEHADELTRLRGAVDEWMKSLDDHGMATEKARRPAPKRKPADEDQDR
ncbi:sulfatase family protein [Luteolibacter marinus]|uniref:sulfatase family protein n=1 Tax=Luteolibacter marinus TaxID=2776705 RepID=UPI0018668C6E|nr:sulfatase [Luteolibacter marinus]